jgi:hypothetical protein
LNQPEWWQSFRQSVIFLFIIFNIYAALAMALPESWPYKKALVNPVRSVLIRLGIYHYLPLYEDPPQNGRHIDFIIIFNDGKQITWRYPRQRLAFWDPPHTFQRYVQQFISWQGENSEVFSSFARFIARQNDSKYHHPVLIRFKAYDCLTPPLINDQSVMSKEVIRSSVLFNYRVSPRDLW